MSGINWVSISMERPTKPQTRAGISSREGDPSIAAARPPAATHHTSSVSLITWKSARPPEKPALVPPHRWADRSPALRAMGCLAKNRGVADILKAMGPTIAKLSAALVTASLYERAATGRKIADVLLAAAELAKWTISKASA